MFFFILFLQWKKPNCMGPQVRADAFLLLILKCMSNVHEMPECAVRSPDKLLDNLASFDLFDLSPSILYSRLYGWEV